jgi:hypothetical protein
MASVRLGMDLKTPAVPKDAKDTIHDEDPIQILCQTTHYELTNLGKALTCPICCATYQNAVMLPCVHAYVSGVALCKPCGSKQNVPRANNRPANEAWWPVLC